jgi:hypothetical protein
LMALIPVLMVYFVFSVDDILTKKLTVCSSEIPTGRFGILPAEIAFWAAARRQDAGAPGVHPPGKTSTCFRLNQPTFPAPLAT